MTIKDVAQLAGVSTATVSRVINQLGGYSHETRAKVEKAVAELGFVRNDHARQLVLGQSSLVAVVLPDVVNLYYTEILESIEAELEHLGYQTILCNTGTNQLKERRYLQRLKDQGVAGIIVCNSGLSDEWSRLVTRRNRQKIVYIDQHPTTDCLFAAKSDFRRGALLATTHLTGLGHTRVAFIAGDQWGRPVEEFYEGYLSGLLRAGLSPDESLVSRTGSELDGGYRQARVLMELGERPTAIVCGDDLLAIGALMSLKELGVDIPGEVAVVGYGDVRLARFTSPSLTTVAVAKAELGRLAASRLVASLRGEDGPEDAITIVESRLVIRESSMSSYASTEQAHEQRVFRSKGLL